MIAAFLLSYALAAPNRANAENPSPNWEEARARTEAQVGIVTALLASDMPEKALEIIADVRSQGDTDGRLEVLQARAMHATGLSTEAQKLLEAHTKAAPRDAQGWSALGVVLADSSDLVGSIRALERARKLSPTDPVILNNLGYAHLAHGDADAAIAVLQASLVQDPSQPRTRNNLGLALASTERDAEALQAFRAAGTESEARYNLAVACLNRGDRASAIAQLHAALQAEPGNAAATAALARLIQEAQ